MFKNLKEKIIFLVVGIASVILAMLIAKLWILVPLAIGVIIATLYYANQRLEGGLPSPIKIAKEYFWEPFKENFNLPPSLKKNDNKDDKNEKN
jgi:membrane protein implicated in regulation of membrane protease activity